MERKVAYANLAKWFEELNDDCDYENWSQYFVKKLRSFGGVEGVDFGCGSGWFTRAFTRAGYTMTGVDISPEMLNYAQEAALKEGVRGEYILGDIKRFRSPKKFDFATAINDRINYIPKKEVDATFQSVKKAFKKGGIFLFDISSAKKFKEKIENTVSVDDRENITYLNFAKEEEDGATMEVTLFVKGKDGRYDRLDEIHRQYAYSEEEIVESLSRCGFTLLGVEGHLGEDKKNADRLLFIARS